MRKSALPAMLVAVCALTSSGVRTQVSGTLPSGWQARDIGAVGLAGSASASGATFTVSGAGADIWGTSDALHFSYRSLTGDGTIVAEVTSIVGAQAWTKVGVMIRGSTQAASAHALMLVSTGKGLAFQRRRATGGVTTHTAGGAGTAPRWVRLSRAGSTVTASASPDGRSWTTVGSDTISLPSTALVGLAVSSHDTTRLATGTFANVSITVAPTASPSMSRLQLTANRRFLRRATDGSNFFYLADTGWGLFKRLTREDVVVYMRDTAAKGFTAVQAVALWNWNSSGAHNAYGDHPLVRVDNRYDPARPLTTAGSNPADPVQYDFWDHVDYILDEAARNGLYVMLEPTWGYYVSGTNSYARDMSSNVFTVSNARIYGEFLGRRYGSRPNILWMLGGDRSAVYSNGDFRPVWRSLAEGIGRGATGQPLAWSEPNAAWSQVLMTYQATRRDDPGSSIWFHADPWLGWNAIQSEYHSITRKIGRDWAKTPVKPTVIVEPRFEDEYATDGVFFTGAHRQRYQLYHALLAGAAGYAYGHTRIWDFSRTDQTWQTALNAPGRLAMNTVWTLLGDLSESQRLNRVPDAALLDGAIGTAQAEDLLVAMRGTDNRYGLVYSTNGRDIRFVSSRLAAGTADAYWFSPRTGRYYNGAGSAVTGPFTSVATGTGAPLAIFNPPGSAGPGNDWILKLVVR